MHHRGITALSPASNNPLSVAASERLLARILARAIPRTFGNAGASGRRDGGRPGLAAGKGRQAGRQASLRALPARRVPTLRSAGRDVTRAAWRA